MENKGAKVVAILLIAAVVIAVIFGIVTLIRSFGGPGETTGPVVTDTTVNRAVQLSVRDDIVAKEEHRRLVFTISSTARTVELIEGYGTDVIDVERYDNSSAAYEEFVYALKRAGVEERRSLDGFAADTRGVCPNGRLYTFEILNDQRVLASTWMTSCSDSEGTFDGNMAATRGLFVDQLPDSSDIVSEADIF